MSLAAITQAAHDQKKRHVEHDYRDVIDGAVHPACASCGPYELWPCPDRVVAERVVQLAADVAATHEKIREHAEAIRWSSGYFSDPLNRLERIHGEAEAILGLLEPSEHTHEETT